jgi:hypothetical protein
VLNKTGAGAVLPPDDTTKAARIMVESLDDAEAGDSFTERCGKART